MVGRIIGRACVNPKDRSKGKFLAWTFLGLPFTFAIFGGAGALFSGHQNFLVLAGAPFVLGYIRGLLPDSGQKSREGR